MKKNSVKAIAFIVVILILGTLSSFSVEWIRGVSIGDIYGTFNLPPLAPPKWLFGPAWVLLYILLGIYCANLNLVKDNQHALYTYMYVQLALNIFWTVVFFSLSNFLLATIMIVIMDLLVIAIIFVDKRRIKLLLVPYLLWLLFATYLSISVLILN
ncbi:TspO/MBR family protein [Leuconostoc suionicum]|uniref:TspO/MBR family protein n=1 Tax=Leuconostoc suionicum TaxID=1511761 RepID=UPI0021A7EA9C|nr:TspO/MBR family protein [Leuconostoc suionicum]MCT4377261.1 tryptophan-rich sensory protein [Leuconostoc suionicum]